MNLFPKPYADAVQRLRVLFGFVLLGTFAWFARPTAESLMIGLPVAAAGVLLRAWAAGHLAKNQQLAMSGPYGHLRNPLYLGTLTAAAGFVIAARQLGLAALFGFVFVFVYLPAIQLEEQHLRKLFADYAEYARRVPLLLPSLRAQVPSTRAFSLALWKKNEEYQALLGYVAGAAYLIWRAFWGSGL